jgi:hypothetical protein
MHSVYEVHEITCFISYNTEMIFMKFGIWGEGSGRNTLNLLGKFYYGLYWSN